MKTANRELTTTIPSDIAKEEDLTELLAWYYNQKEIERSTIFKLLNIIPESINPYSYKIILTNPIIKNNKSSRSWFIDKCIKIDEFSGNLSNAVDLLEIGSIVGVELDDVLEKTKILEEIVYRNNDHGIFLSDFLYLSDREFYINITNLDKQLGLNYLLKTYQLLYEGNYWYLLGKCSTESLDFYRLCAISIILTRFYLTDPIYSILSFLPEEMKNTDFVEIPLIYEANDILKWQYKDLKTLFTGLFIIVKQIDLIQEVGFSIGVKDFYKFLYCKNKFLVKFLRKVIPNIIDHNGLDTLLQNIYYISTIKPENICIFNGIDRDTILVEFIKVLLQNESNIFIIIVDFSGAKKILTEKLFEDNNKKVSLVIDVSRDFFDKSLDANINNGQLSLDCIENTTETKNIIDLASAADILINEIDTTNTLMPIQVRASKNRLSFMQEKLILSKNEKYKNIELIMNLSYKLGIDVSSLTQRLSVYEVLVLVSNHKSDYTNSYIVILDMFEYLETFITSLSKSYGNSNDKNITEINEQFTKICRILIDETKFSDIDKRATIINHVLKICSTNQIGEWISYHKELQLTTDLLNLKSIPGLISLKYKLRQYLDLTKKFKLAEPQELSSIKKHVSELIKSICNFINIDDLLKKSDKLTNKNNSSNERYLSDIRGKYSRSDNIIFQALILCDALLKSHLSLLYNNEVVVVDENILQMSNNITQCIFKYTLDKETYNTIINLLSISKNGTDKLILDLLKEYPLMLLYYVSVKLWANINQKEYVDSSRIMTLTKIDPVELLTSLGIYSSNSSANLDLSVIEVSKTFKNFIDMALSSLNQSNKHVAVLKLINEVDFVHIEKSEILLDKIQHDDKYLDNLILGEYEFYIKNDKTPVEINKKLSKLENLILLKNNHQTLIFDLLHYLIKYKLAYKKSVKLLPPFYNYLSSFDPHFVYNKLESFYKEVDGSNYEVLLTIFDLEISINSSDTKRKIQIETRIEILNKMEINIDYKEFIVQCLRSVDLVSFLSSYISLDNVFVLVSQVRDYSKFIPIYKDEKEIEYPLIQYDINKLEMGLYVESILNELKKDISIDDIDNCEIVIQQLDETGLEYLKNKSMDILDQSNNLTLKSRLLEFISESMPYSANNDIKDEINNTKFKTLLEGIRDPVTNNNVSVKLIHDSPNKNEFKLFIDQVIEKQNEPIIIYKIIDAYVQCFSPQNVSSKKLYTELFEEFVKSKLDKTKASLFINETITYFNNEISIKEYKIVIELHQTLLLSWIDQFGLNQIDLIPKVINSLMVVDEILLSKSMNNYLSSLLKEYFQNYKFSENITILENCLDLFNSSSSYEDFAVLVRVMIIYTHMEIKGGSRLQDVIQSWIRFILILMKNGNVQLCFIIFNHFDFLFSYDDEIAIWGQIKIEDTIDKYKVGLLFKNEDSISEVIASLIEYLNEELEPDINLLNDSNRELKDSFKIRLDLVSELNVLIVLINPKQIIKFYERSINWFEIILYRIGKIRIINETGYRRLVYKLVICLTRKNLFHYCHWLVMEFLGGQQHSLLAPFTCIANFIQSPPSFCPKLDTNGCSINKMTKVGYELKEIFSYLDGFEIKSDSFYSILMDSYLLDN